MLFSGQMFCQVFCTLPCLRPPFMVNPALLFGLTYRTVNLFHVRQACKCSSGLLHMSLCIYYSSALFSSKPSSFSFAKTSSNDLRPRLRTFIISSEVLFVNSSTVLIPALFKQLYERTDNSHFQNFFFLVIFFFYHNFCSLGILRQINKKS